MAAPAARQALSGGQRTARGAARALILEPKVFFLLADDRVGAAKEPSRCRWS